MAVITIFAVHDASGRLAQYSYDGLTPVGDLLPDGYRATALNLWEEARDALLEAGVEAQRFYSTPRVDLVLNAVTGNGLDVVLVLRSDVELQSATLMLNGAVVSTKTTSPWKWVGLVSLSDLSAGAYGVVVQVVHGDGSTEVVEGQHVVG